MRIESKLCHVSDSKAIVQVTGWLNEVNLGSALAEGSTVEVAEDRAIDRLKERVNAATNNETKNNYVNEDSIKTQSKLALQKNETININHDPIDWSNELTAIDEESAPAKTAKAVASPKENQTRTITTKANIVK